MKAVDFGSNEELLNIAQFLDLKEKYNNITVDDLVKLREALSERFDEKAAQEAIRPFTEIIEFYETIAPKDNEELYEIVTFKTNDEGIEAVYGPACFKDENENIVIKVGDKSVPVNVKGFNEEIGRILVSVGALKGSFEFTDNTDNQNNNRVEGRLNLKGKQGSYSLRTILNIEEEGVTALTIENDIEAGGNLAKYFRQIPKRGGTYYKKLKDLEIGDYGIRGTFRKDSPWGTQVILQLDDGSNVTANSPLGKRVSFAYNFNLASGLSEDEATNKVSQYFQTQKLRIYNKEQRGDRTFVKADFVDRETGQPSSDKEESTESKVEGQEEVFNEF